MSYRRTFRHLVTLLRAHFIASEAPFAGPTLIDQVPDLLHEAGPYHFPTSTGR